jgi:hypothetical protein
LKFAGGESISTFKASTRTLGEGAQSVFPSTQIQEIPIS